MTKELNWQTDPVVVLEGCILPVLTAGPEALCRLTMAEQHPPDGSRLDGYFQTFAKAENHLRNGGSQFLGPVGMRLRGDDLEQCVKAAELVATAKRQLESAVAEFQSSGRAVNGKGRQIADYMSELMTPGVNAALNVFRRIFIGTVLERQSAHARQAEAAIRQLSEIGETIFFISINASIEAARIGEKGRGIAVIGEDIRDLSQKARAATWSLSAILEGASKSEL